MFLEEIFIYFSFSEGFIANRREFVVIIPVFRTKGLQFHIP